MLCINTKEEFLKYYQKSFIACLGAGSLGKRFIEEFGIKNVIFFDNDKEKHGRLLSGEDSYEVYPIDHLKDICERRSTEGMDVVIIITSGAYSVLYRQLQDLGLDRYKVFVYPFTEPRDVMLQKMVRQCLSDYYYHNHMDLEKREEFINREYDSFPKDAFIIPYMPVYVTTRCTLNCEKCNNLMPYLRDNPKDFSPDEIMQSLSAILSCVHEMTFCELVGGETFLYRDLDVLLDFLGNQKKIRQIVVVTNGTVIPDEDVLERLAKYNVLVRISDYGLFEKMSRLVVELEKRDINTRVLQDMKWNDPGGIESRTRTNEEIYFQYNKCVFSLRCKYLSGDKLFTCARIASMSLLGKQIYDEDVLSIDEKLTAAALRNFYLNDFGRGCDHCDLCSIDGGDVIPAAVQKGGRAIKRSHYTIIRNDYLERLKRK